jgi:hypothetical protein
MILKYEKKKKWPSQLIKTVLVFALALCVNIGSINQPAAAGADCSSSMTMLFGDATPGQINTDSLCGIQNAPSVNCYEGSFQCGSECCDLSKSCVDGQCVCDPDKIFCAAFCCNNDQYCDGSYCHDYDGPTLYCVASIYKEGRCIQYEMCYGEVIDIPGHTVQKCSIDSNKQVHYAFNARKGGLGITGNPNAPNQGCLYSLCEWGDNGYPCCSCDMVQGEFCINQSCAILSPEDISELNACMGYPDTASDAPDEGDGGGSAECKTGTPFNGTCERGGGHACPTGPNYELECCCGACIHGEAQ